MYVHQMYNIHGKFKKEMNAVKIIFICKALKSISCDPVYI